MSEAVLAFHLLRPWWLIALAPATLILWLILRRERGETQWSGAVSPHLLKHMIVAPQRVWRIRSVYLVFAALVLGILALAGPTWRRERPPFVEDKAPLMIALDVSASMGQTDVPPSRLERGKQKIRDLLAARAGARTGLIAYAGTAHLVMPLTDDRNVIEPFLASLTPGLMPVQGKNPTAAVALAAEALTNENFAGTILLTADGTGEADATAIRRAAGRNGTLLLAVAPPGATNAPIDTVQATVDDSDIRSLERRIDTQFQSAQADQAGTRWRDEGYWLVLPIALLSLIWFRRGMTVQWIVLFMLLHGAPADAQTPEGAHRFASIWLTPDQQGRLAFDRGDYAQAARLFSDPMWRGIAAYRAYDFLTAAEAFRKIDTVEGWFALGNAEAQNHAWEKSMAAYDEVLKAQPDNAAAKINRAIVVAALKAREDKRRKQEQDDPAPPDEKAD
ncbi:MAG: VWA domain-containing protein, partial [Pseudolabrys sp.]